VQTDEEEGRQDEQACVRLSDVLPGGATIIWGSADRPAWFLQLRNAEKNVPTVRDASVSVLSSKQQKRSHQAALKVLKKHGGTCRFKEVLRDVMEYVSGKGETPCVAGKRATKKFLKESDAWTIRKGVVRLV
jgi:hypothetical protein